MGVETALHYIEHIAQSVPIWPLSLKDKMPNHYIECKWKWWRSGYFAVYRYFRFSVKFSVKFHSILTLSINRFDSIDAFIIALKIFRIHANRIKDIIKNWVWKGCIILHFDRQLVNYLLAYFQTQLKSEYYTINSSSNGKQ